MKRTLLAAFLALIAAGVLFAVAASTRSNDHEGLLQTVATAQVTAAGFYISLPVEGVVEAARSVPERARPADAESQEWGDEATSGARRSASRAGSPRA